MSFCPLLSTAEKEISCSENCALFAENKQCAIRNLGNIDLKDMQETIHYRLFDINDQLNEIRQK